jgi:hypothetical protein
MNLAKAVFKSFVVLGTATASSDSKGQKVFTN